METNDLSNSVIFPKGDPLNEALQKFFSGKTYISTLVSAEALDCSVSNVTFEPGCRNNWHIHRGGQILLVTGGRGWYQEEGKEARKLKAGDAVAIPRNIKHWHGAAKDSWFIHLALGTNADEGPMEWLEPVSDEHYNKLER